MEASDFFVEELLDLSNGGDEMITDAFFDSITTTNSTDSSALTPASDSCNSSVSTAPSFPDSYFSGTDLCVPYDDMAELEWLSNFVEESFSTDELHRLQFIPTGPAQPTQTRPGPNPLTVPGKARSKRSRVAPCDWSTRLLMVSSPSPASSSSSNNGPSPGPKKQPTSKSRRDNNSIAPGEVRRCLHCAAEKTPQWRTGPMGPKTLCNACGVRYKSGRLVPEYRPAASPTFVTTKHSNSHRKVIELRRQKEVHRHHQQPPQQFIGGAGNHHMVVVGGGGGGEDYFIHHHHHLGATDYRQMI